MDKLRILLHLPFEVFQGRRTSFRGMWTYKRKRDNLAQGVALFKCRVLHFWAAVNKSQVEEKLPLLAAEHREMVDKEFNTMQDPLAVAALTGQAMEFKS